MYIQKVLQLTKRDTRSALLTWMVPSAAYALAEIEHEKAVELLSWVYSYPDISLSWVHQWSLFTHLQSQLQEMLDTDTYQLHREKGEALTFDTVVDYLYSAFHPSSTSEAVIEACHHQLLTARENDILRLLAAGLTNPQIAQELVIGAGTVKTHTLNIYRKLDVANRTQAIVRAQALGLLSSDKIYH
jgi:DNA-binding NarL/FixJ family response regulator